MDISFESITIECPNCQFLIDLILKQIISEETIICPGCLNNIHLVDNGSSFKHINQGLIQAVDELENSLRKFGRIL